MDHESTGYGFLPMPVTLRRKSSFLAKQAALAFGARRALKPGLRVLAYHELPAPGVFAEHVTMLKSECELIGIDEVVALCRSERPWPRTTTEVLITADDGYANQFSDEYLTIVSEMGIRPHVFLIGAALAPDVLKRLPHLEIDEHGMPRPLVSLAAIKQAMGVGWTVGAHTWTHRDAAALSPADLYDELVGGADRIAQFLGCEIETFAWPWGRRQNTSPHAMNLAKGRFAASFSTEAGCNREAGLNQAFIRRDVVTTGMSVRDVRGLLGGALDLIRSRR